jgi:ornithine cyclodeaminase
LNFGGQIAMHSQLSASETAERLPYAALAKEIESVLRDVSVQVPTRLVQPLPGGGSLFVMPALDRRIAITKVITFTPANAGTKRPTIHGDIVVFDIVTGRRQLILDGPTVTARRTAAVSLLAAQYLAPQRSGPLLIVGAGVQGRAHLEAFVQGLGVQDVMIASRSHASARALVGHAKALGVKACVVTDPNAALARCSLVVTCTPASVQVLQANPRADTFIAAVGAFTPRMVELGPELCQHLAQYGTVVVDTRDADHEAGDLLQAGLDVGQFATLRDVVRNSLPRPNGPVLFKSCGWAGWDLAAARTAAAKQQ